MPNPGTQREKVVRDVQCRLFGMHGGGTIGRLVGRGSGMKGKCGYAEPVIESERVVAAVALVVGEMVVVLESG